MRNGAGIRLIGLIRLINSQFLIPHSSFLIKIKTGYLTKATGI